MHDITEMLTGSKMLLTKIFAGHLGKGMEKGH